VKYYDRYLEDGTKVAQEFQISSLKIDGTFLPQVEIMTQLSNNCNQKRLSLEIIPHINKAMMNDNIETLMRRKASFIPLSCRWKGDKKYSNMS
jgi:hypothetical protein